MLSSEDLAFFAVIASSASLAESARKLNVTPPAVTQRLRGLEARIGIHLVDRTGKRLRLTDEGALVASHGAVVADAIAALSEALADRKGAIGGHLNVVAPHGFGRVHVAPVVDAFARLHPGVSATLELSDHPGARLVESCDVVVHIGLPGPMDQIVTTLAPNRRFLCAAPSYLAAHPAIEKPADLLSHRCLVLRENDEDVTLWRLHHATRPATAIRVQATLATNDGQVIRDWAIGGQGIAIRSEWDVARDVVEGRLVQVMPQWEPPSANVIAMLGARKGRTARTTAFLGMLRRAFSPPPWRS